MEDKEPQTMTELAISLDKTTMVDAYTPEELEAIIQARASLTNEQMDFMRKVIERQLEGQ